MTNDGRDSLERLRGLQAWLETQTALKKGIKSDDLAGLVSETETRIRLAGVGSALAYLEEKATRDESSAAAPRELLRTIEDWMRQRFPGGSAAERLPERLSTGGADLWMAVTAEAFAYLTWLKVMTRLHGRA